MPSYEYNKEYAKKYMGKLDEIKIRIPKGRKADIEAHAQNKGLSVNALIVSLLQTEMNMTDEEWKHNDGSTDPRVHKTPQS